MRILHVLNHTYRLNGHVHAAVDLACAQARLGHTVLVCSGGGSFDDLLRENGVDVIRIDQFRRPLVIARALLALSRQACTVDIVHAHMMTSALLAWPGCILHGTPLITTVHNAFERSAVAMGVGRRVIAVSAAVGRSMADRGIPARRLRVVLNGTIGSARLDSQVPPPPPPFRASLIDAEMDGGVDGPAAVPGARAPNLLFIGGLHPRKGVADLLDAFERVHATRPDTCLTIVGEGPHADAYKERVARMAGASAVTFSGGQSDPRPFLAAADIFILPSLADPAPLVISEARAAGCAVVATAVDGIPELLENGRAGILVPPGDPTQLGDAILALVTNPEKLVLWKRNSQHNIEHLCIARVARETLAVYAECLQSGRRQSQPKSMSEYRASPVDGDRRS
ncbi:glycosyltransferase family 4 protein [Methylobacterium sp. J-090]|nr:glycosyltransferase family 4 protein [Methylobacterium sp. J-090]